MFKFKKEYHKLLKDLVLLGLLFIFGGLIMGTIFLKSSYFTGEGHFKTQPIAFSHRLHVHEVGLNCQFCHQLTEKDMTMPPVQTCYGCHREVLKEASFLEPVRKTHEEGKEIRWNRVNRLPTASAFKHSDHVRAGIDCIKCHGNVEEMPLMIQQNMSEQWCLKCHETMRKQ